MSRFSKKRSVKSGLPAGTVVHIGEKARADVTITVMCYSEGSFMEKTVSSVDECIAFCANPGQRWIIVEGVHRQDILQKFGDYFKLHPLLIEDLANTDQRTKLEDYGDYVFVVLKMLELDKAAGKLIPEQAANIIGPNFILTFLEGFHGDPFKPIKEQLRSGKGRVRTMGMDYLMYMITDAVVDNYFTILEHFDDEIEAVEEKLLADPSTGSLSRLQGLKRELILLRRSVWPLREVLNGMERCDSPLFTPQIHVYIRDVYDHAVQVIDTVEIFREILSEMIDIYLSSINNRMNSVMKVLTIIATIFIPLTFIAGVYGMNFDFMPELRWKLGYPVVVSGMCVIGLFMLLMFKRKKWF